MPLAAPEGRTIAKPTKEQYQDFFGVDRKKVELHQKIESYQVPTSQMRLFIEDSFGEEIKSLGMEKKLVGMEKGLGAEKGDNYKYVLENLFMMAMDTGTNIPHNFEGRTAERQLILNRQAALSEIRKKSGLKQSQDNNYFAYKTKFKILKMDIANFRKADKIGAGDYNLNIFVKALQEAVMEISTDKSTNININNLVVGRYGGDEFILGIMDDGNGSLGKIKEIETIIRKKVGGYSGFFEKNVPAKSFSLNKFEEYDLPVDHEDRAIYLANLNKNILLNSEQLGLDKEYFKSHSNSNLQKYLEITKVRNIYPRNIESLTDEAEKSTAKIKYLIKNHSELQVPFYLMEHMDMDEKFKDPKMPFKHRQFMLDFIENYMLDPLLDEVAMSRFDIVSHIEKGEFSRLHSFEFKLKEINEKLSYSYSDELIADFWLQTFKKKFREEIQKGIIKIGRVGGSIFIGETKPVDGVQKLGLSDEKKGFMESVNKFNKKYKGADINHEIGYASLDLDPNGYSHEVAKAKFSELFKKTTDDWLQRTFSRIVSDENEFNLFIKLLNDPDGKNDRNISSKNMLTLLSARYFTGSRFEDRIPNAQIVLNALGRTKNGRLQEIFDNLVSLNERKLAGTELIINEMFINR